MMRTVRKYIDARNMVPGKTYVGTGDGPTCLHGVAFTVVAVVSFSLDGGVPTDMDSEALSPFLQVVYDASAYPFPEATVFSEYDIVAEVEEES